MVSPGLSAKTPSAATLLRFVTDHLRLSVPELIALRDAIEAHLQARVGVPPPTPRRTLSLATDPLDDLG